MDALAQYQSKSSSDEEDTTSIMVYGGKQRKSGTFDSYLSRRRGRSPDDERTSTGSWRGRGHNTFRGGGWQDRGRGRGRGRGDHGRPWRGRTAYYSDYPTRARSPDDRSRSPNTCSRSPDARSRSPHSRSRSSQHHSRSPQHRSRSPQRQSRSPQRQSRSRHAHSRSPGKRLSSEDTSRHERSQSRETSSKKHKKKSKKKKSKSKKHSKHSHHRSRPRSRSWSLSSSSDESPSRSSAGQQAPAASSLLDAANLQEIWKHVESGEASAETIKMLRGLGEIMKEKERLKAAHSKLRERESSDEVGEKEQSVSPSEYDESRQKLSPNLPSSRSESRGYSSFSKYIPPVTHSHASTIPGLDFLKQPEPNPVPTSQQRPPASGKQPPISTSHARSQPPASTRQVSLVSLQPPASTGDIRLQPPASTSDVRQSEMDPNQLTEICRNLESGPAGKKAIELLAELGQVLKTNVGGKESEKEKMQSADRGLLREQRHKQYDDGKSFASQSPHISGTGLQAPHQQVSAPATTTFPSGTSGSQHTGGVSKPVQPEIAALLAKTQSLFGLPTSSSSPSVSEDSNQSGYASSNWPSGSDAASSKPVDVSNLISKLDPQMLQSLASIPAASGVRTTPAGDFRDSSSSSDFSYSSSVAPVSATGGFAGHPTAPPSALHRQGQDQRPDASDHNPLAEYASAVKQLASHVEQFSLPMLSSVLTATSSSLPSTQQPGTSATHSAPSQWDRDSTNQQQPSLPMHMPSDNVSASFPPMPQQQPPVSSSQWNTRSSMQQHSIPVLSSADAGPQESLNLTPTQRNLLSDWQNINQATCQKLNLDAPAQEMYQDQGQTHQTIYDRRKRRHEEEGDDMQYSKQQKNVQQSSSSTLYLEGLGHLTKEDLLIYFSRYGSFKGIYIDSVPADHLNKTGVVEFDRVEQAQTAYEDGLHRGHRGLSYHTIRNKIFECKVNKEPGDTSRQGGDVTSQELDRLSSVLPQIQSDIRPKPKEQQVLQETNILFVSNLENLSDKSIHRYFVQYGVVKQLSHTGPKGTCYVTFATTNEAVAAYFDSLVSKHYLTKTLYCLCYKMDRYSEEEPSNPCRLLVSDAIDLSVRGVAAHFAKYGKVVDIDIDDDGYGYMDFETPEQVEAVIQDGDVRSRHCINDVYVFCKFASDTDKYNNEDLDHEENDTVPPQDGIPGLDLTFSPGRATSPWPRHPIP